VRGGVNDLYRSLALARRDPGRVTIAFLCAVGRLGSDWIALYFAFLAVGYPVPLGTVLMIFIVSTSVATLTIVPGQSQCLVSAHFLLAADSIWLCIRVEFGTTGESMKSENKRYRGIVKSFAKNKGYGFIVWQEGNRELFVHYSAIARAGRRNLEVGEQVEFGVKETDKGWQAVHVIPLQPRRTDAFGKE
jgi:CspA family cold shock protein